MRTSRSTLPLTLLVSSVLHVALLAVALAPEPAHAGGREGAGADRPDRWVGDTFDVELLDGPTESPEPPAPALARPAPASDPRPVVVPPPAPPPVANDSQVAPTIVSADEADLATSPQPKAGSTATADHDEPDEPTERTDPTDVTAPVGVVDVPPSGLPRAEASATAARPSSGTSFGAQGTGGAVRQLGRAFTRALPAAALPKDGWLALPIGVGPVAQVTLTLDESGQLLEPDFGDDPVPSILAKLIHRTHLLLKRGRFAIDDDPGAGSETFAIHLEVSDEPPTDDPFAEPGHIMRRGFEPPRPDRAGRAHFTFASGRHVVVHVELAP